MMLNSSSGSCTTYSAALYGKILEKCFDSLEPTLESAVAAYGAAALSLGTKKPLNTSPLWIEDIHIVRVPNGILV